MGCWHIFKGGLQVGESMYSIHSRCMKVPPPLYVVERGRVHVSFFFLFSCVSAALLLV